MGFSPREARKLLTCPDPLILEAGAHRGEDTARFLESFPKARIYCFEPDPRCIRHFLKNVSDPRCTLIPAAVSNRNALVPFYMSAGTGPQKTRTGRILHRLSRIPGLGRILSSLPGLKKFQWDASSSIEVPISGIKRLPWLHFKKSSSVKTVRLDTWLDEQQISSVDLIWSDVQGAEKAMIQGMGHRIDKVHYIFMEYGEKDVYPAAMERGETVALMQQHGFLPVDEYCDPGPVGNLLFVNRHWPESPVR